MDETSKTTPSLFALLSDKTAATYKLLLRSVLQRKPELNPMSVMMTSKPQQDKLFNMCFIVRGYSDVFSTLVNLSGDELRRRWFCVATQIIASTGFRTGC
jgi:hypothetical protein